MVSLRGSAIISVTSLPATKESAVPRAEKLPKECENSSLVTILKIQFQYCTAAGWSRP